MSKEMAKGDSASGEEGKLKSDDAAAASVAEPERASSNQQGDPAPPQTEEATAAPTEVKIEPTTTEQSDNSDKTDRGVKRRASIAFSETSEEFHGFSEATPEEDQATPKEEEFKGFDQAEQKDLSDYNRILERLETEITEARKSFTPLRTVVANLAIRAGKRARQDTDGSRPSSALSSRSDGDGALSTETASAASSPANRRRVTSDLSSPLLRVPLERGWKRELVYRAALDAHSRRNADIYYYTPRGKKLRSTREVAEHLAGSGLTLDNFSFFKEPLGVDDPEKEIIRDAKMMRRVESPISSPAPVAVEGKRTPKPKPPKGASPDRAPLRSPPAKIKVKSVGSRLSSSAPAAAQAQTAKQHKRPLQTAANENNNTAAWKKPSDVKKTRMSNGAAAAGGTSELTSPRRRGRARHVDDTDHFMPFYKTAAEKKYNVAFQILQYLGMRELAHCARVCKLWRQLAAAPALWRHVRMKNSQVSDWGGLCSALKRHRTKRLDLRKMLLPKNDAPFWDQFAKHIATVDTLERIEMCRCPASAVEAVCRGLPHLTSLSALAIKDALLDPAPLAQLTRLQELRLKSLSGLSLTRDLRPLASLKHLTHLSLTSIKELGWCVTDDVIGHLSNLESLELGECTFREEFADTLRKLTKLRRLRLERGTAQCAAPALLRALASLPLLNSLELVNVDVKVGFDEALAECKNIQRLLIIPTYVSQSATTNRQVLSGVLQLKETLTHLMWGVTIELLRVTELFIDQCEKTGEPRRHVGECIPMLKPVPGCRTRAPQPSSPPQVEILPLPTLQKLLSTQLPHTKLKLLRIPFHATWRQSLADFQ